MQIFTEKLQKGYHQSFDIERVIVDEQSRFQHVCMFDTPALGRVLVLDDVVQLTERDEFTYSEMLAHVPILEHGQVRSVLIIGGGDGAIAEEVLKHKDVERVDLVDIDDRVIELSREHLASVHNGAFDDPRLHVHPRDAVAFLREKAGGPYDVVISDRPDPKGPAVGLFEQGFYGLLKEAMNPGAYAVFQTGVPFFQDDELRTDRRLLAETFPASGVYLTVTPTYIGGYMALTWAGTGDGLGRGALADTIARRYHEKGLQTRYYSPAVHLAAFVLPPWIEALG